MSISHITPLSLNKENTTTAPAKNKDGGSTTRAFGKNISNLGNHQGGKSEKVVSKKGLQVREPKAQVAPKPSKAPLQRSKQVEQQIPYDGELAKIDLAEIVKRPSACPFAPEDFLDLNLPDKAPELEDLTAELSHQYTDIIAALEADDEAGELEDYLV